MSVKMRLAVLTMMMQVPEKRTNLIPVKGKGDTEGGVVG